MAAGPNIVWLFADQHRADVLGASGHPVVQTPHLDALAAEGLAFEKLYCQGPLCVPARVSLLTERYVRDHGAFENDYQARTDLPTTVQAIRDAGYHTTAIGKMHLFPHFPDVAEGLPLMHHLGFEEVDEVVGKLASGFVRSAYTEHLAEHGLLDVFHDFVRDRTPWLREAGSDGKPMWTVDPNPLPPEHYLDAWVGRRAAHWIENRTSDQPFFCWIGFPGPHDPWDAPEEYVRRYANSDIPLDTTRRPQVPPDGPLAAFLRVFLGYSSTDTLSDDRAREVRRHYFANVTVIDEAVGEVRAALERKGIADRTWIIYSSDHGEMLGTHGLLNKMVFYEPSVRVPLIIRPPRGMASGRVSALLEHVDLSATLRSIAGAGPVEGSEGKSFADAFDVTRDDQPRTVGREVVVSENFGFAMWRTRDYKLVVYEKDSSPVQLFDLTQDPDEDDNKIDDPAYAAVLAEMMDSFAKPFLATAPLRPGPDIVERGGNLRRRTPPGRPSVPTD